MFYDSVRIKVTGGRGGNGCVHFNRDIHNPKGVPAGGTGGNGGLVIIKATSEKKTFIDIAQKKVFKAGSGGNGGRTNKHGRNGKTLVIQVPIGTVVYDSETSDFITDLNKDGMEIAIAAGGRGGSGNAAFVSGKMRFPHIALKGLEGDERLLRLELKLLADVALIGFPNAGKSTLISRISAAKPKIADYPFTTLRPNLGMVKYDNYKSLIIADIPGLIEGAADGAGLGTKFLKHIERTRIICHLLDLTSVLEGRSPINEYNAVRSELIKFKPDLGELPEIVLGNKIDIPEAKKAGYDIENYFKEKEIPLMLISAISGEGLDIFVKKLGYLFNSLNMESRKVVHQPDSKVLIKVEPDKIFTIKKIEDNFYRLTCIALTKLILQIDFRQKDALNFFNHQLRKMRVEEALIKHGVQEGDTVIIDDFEFEYKEGL